VNQPIDPYKVLQVDPEAEDEVIQAAYRRLARKYHPDVAPDAESAARMTAINAAWDLLGDPIRRAVHDRERARASASASAATPHPPPVHASPRATAPPPAAAPPRPPDAVSSDWTSGRSSHGGGYDPERMGTPDGLGAAGPPPGNPSGSVLGFGRYANWSLGEIARTNVEYLEWLDRMPIGRPYRDEIDAILRRSGRRRSAAAESQERRGLFRRR
jgi:curved DNA-binding protein CbpA